MPVELDDEDPRIVYGPAAGGETDYDFPFLVYADSAGGSSHLDVYRVRAGTAVELTVSTHYTVDGLDEEAGGTITLVTPAVAGDYYILQRELPIETFFNFATGGDYFATQVNQGNNLTLQILQQLRLMIRRSAALPPDTILDAIEMPPPVAGKYVGWNAAATALENKDGTVAGTDESAKVSSNDTTAGYLNGKLVASDNVTLTENVDGGNETLTIKGKKDASLQNYTEAVDLHGSAVVGATETIDLANGNVHKILLDVNCTLTFTGAPAAGIAASFTLYVKQDSSGGNTITWPASVQWRGGVAPVQTTSANALDIYVFSSIDGGVSWQGCPVGAGFA